jgi:hypothetical protein
MFLSLVSFNSWGLCYTDTLFRMTWNFEEMDNDILEADM